MEAVDGRLLGNALLLRFLGGDAQQGLSRSEPGPGVARVVDRVRGKAMRRISLVHAQRRKSIYLSCGWTNRGDQEGDGDGLLRFRHDCGRCKEFGERGLENQGISPEDLRWIKECGS